MGVGGSSRWDGWSSSWGGMANVEMDCRKGAVSGGSGFSAHSRSCAFRDCFSRKSRASGAKILSVSTCQSSCFEGGAQRNSESTGKFKCVMHLYL